MLTLDATVDGVPQLINRLKGFEPEVYKILQRDVRAAADLIGASARGMIPSEPPTSHWAASGRTAWNSGAVRSSIRPGFRSRNIGGTRVVSGVVTGYGKGGGAAGKLYAVTGGGATGNTRLGALLNAKWGTATKSGAPRAMGPAWHMHVDDAREGIKQAVHRAAGKVSNG